MTAHANGGGEGDSSDVPNEQIRAHVATNSRILFDFSDIENYDPDENYFLDKLLNDALYYDSDNNGSRDANWAEEYLARHDGGELDRLGQRARRADFEPRHALGPGHRHRVRL